MEIKYRNTATEIKAVCDDLADMLIGKNESYGDSALNPRRIFSRADQEEQLNVRLDDKLSRIADGKGNAFHEDTELDLLGYLILKRVYRLRKKREALREGGEGGQAEPQYQTSDESEDNESKNVLSNEIMERRLRRRGQTT